ncbi:MAG: OmpA family protein [Alphaproteobacteria bacterium]|nr:OmpA family protein [Alphaproteobacteria bacterium]
MLDCSADDKASSEHAPTFVPQVVSKSIRFLPWSLRRANAVSNYLRLQGVDGNRIVTDGLGSKNPIASNATSAGREQNRRVEITLINRS